ncbi:MAG TPA: hypothetical protein VHB79_28385 [Polyangiaceae bacterium]|nr:hypothetical protein [Polyangiaceae bacterium]
MLLRFKCTGRLSVAGGCLLLACSTTPSNDVGRGGSSNTGGTAAAGTSAGGNSGSGGGGSSNAGSGTTAGTSGAGMTTGGAGASAGGTGGSAGGGAGTSGSGGSGGGSASKSKTTFFVTSDTSKTGNLGGVTAADKRCQDLATKAGIGDHTFHAYLSTENPPVNAKDRIGTGPWVNSNGVTLATSVAELHSGKIVGDPTLFIDENKMQIHGQWDGGTMVEHDILTGSKADGTVQTGVTCKDWTSAAAGDKGQVGHSDGMGPNKATTGTYTSWNSAHASGSCADTAQAGGAGRLYCFAID